MYSFNNKGKKPINMATPKPHTPQQPFSPQYTPKTPKSFNSQIYSPQPFTPMSYNSQFYSPQPFTPLHSSKPNTPKRPKTPNQFPPRSSNNSPFEMASSSNLSPNGYGIHHSNSTSKLYIRDNRISTAVGASPTNLNSLYPPNYSYGGKHNNKKQAVHKVYQHTRKVVNDDNNEAVEVSEVTQQLYKVNGQDVQRGETSLYSFTTYTSNDNKKKIKHTHSNIEIHSFLSDSSSDGGDSSTSSPVSSKYKNSQPSYGENHVLLKPNIECIPSQGSLEENDDETPKKYNVPLNDTINKPHQRKYSFDHTKNNFEHYNNSNTQNQYINFQRKNSDPHKESIPINHRKHFSDHAKYNYTGNNHSEYEDGQINIVIRNPESNVVSPSSNYSEETYKEDYSNLGSPKSSYSVFSTTYQKK